MCNFENNDLDLYLLIWRYFQLIVRKKRIVSKVCMIWSQFLVKKKVITNENQLYSSEKSTQCSAVTYMGRKSKKVGIYVYM